MGISISGIRAIWSWVANINPKTQIKMLARMVATLCWMLALAILMFNYSSWPSPASATAPSPDSVPSSGCSAGASVPETTRTGSPSVRYAWPTVTSCCPAERPVRTSVTPLPVRPVETSTYLAAPSSTTKTYRVSPRVSTASVGTTMVFSDTSVWKVTSANMPASSPSVSEGRDSVTV